MSKINEKHWDDSTGPVSIKEYQREFTTHVHNREGYRDGIYITIKEFGRESFSKPVSNEPGKQKKVFKFYIDPKSVKENGTATLIATLDGKAVTAIYTVNKAEIATISGSTVTGISFGSTKIIASYTDDEGNEYTGTATLAVEKLEFKVTANELSVTEGDEVTLTATYGATDVTTDTVFTSGNTAVATVAGNKVTTKAKGTVKVTGKYAAKDISGLVTIEVAELGASVAPSISNTKGTVIITGDGEIYYTTDGTNPTVSSTKYTTPFSVTSGTVVKAIAVQTGLKPSNVVSKTVTFTVAGPTITSVTLDKGTIWDTDTDKNETVTVKVTAGDNPITKVTIDGEEVTGDGTYILTKAVSANKTWTVKVEDGVTAAVTNSTKSTIYKVDTLSVTLSSSSVKEGKTVTATAELASGKAVTDAVFTVDNVVNAIVSENIITGVTAGTTKVIAESAAYSKTSTAVTLTVTAIVKAVTVSGSNPTSATGTTTLAAKYTEDGVEVTGKTFTWSIEPTVDYASIDSTGKLTAANTEAIAKTVNVYAECDGIKSTKKVITIPAKEVTYKLYNAYCGAKKSTITEEKILETAEVTIVSDRASMPKEFNMNHPEDGTGKWSVFAYPLAFGKPSKICNRGQQTDIISTFEQLEMKIEGVDCYLFASSIVQKYDIDLYWD